ncbi:hypothetical protein J6590_046834 [Homalodisca vitripennis]|nr:hypothetical protein J6590_046834 [Homalodisca vitripennis]
MNSNEAVIHLDNNLTTLAVDLYYHCLFYLPLVRGLQILGRTGAGDSLITVADSSVARLYAPWRPVPVVTCL